MPFGANNAFRGKPFVAKVLRFRIEAFWGCLSGCVTKTGQFNYFLNFIAGHIMTKCLYIVPDVSVLSFLLQVMATRRFPQTKSPTSPADFSRDSPQSRSKSRGRSTERTRRRGASDSEEPKRPGAGDSEEKKARK